jgi:hypothetical protein
MKIRHVQHNMGRRLRGWMGRWVSVARGFPTTGSSVWGVWGVCGGRIGVGGGVWGLRVVGGAVKEGEDGYVAVDGKDLGEEIGGVDRAGEEDMAEKLLARPLLQPVETHVYRLGLLRANRGSRKTDSTFVIGKKKGRGGRLLGMAKVLSQHLSTTKSGGILRLGHRRNHQGYALTEIRREWVHCG